MNKDLLQVEEVRAGDHTTISLFGELDVSSSPFLIERLADVAFTRPLTIDVDLTGLTYIDSTGLSAFVTAHFQCLDAGITLRFVDPDVFVEDVLTVTGVGEVLQVHRSIDQARLSLSERAGAG